MGPLAPLLIGAGAGILGNIFSASQANRFSERMSSTSHQREVADLRSAGLNPVLSANRGASSPVGANPDVTGGAQRGALLSAQVDLTKAQATHAIASARQANAAAMATEQLTPRDLSLKDAEIQIADANASQAKGLAQALLDKARQEVRSLAARSLLDEYAASGAFNEKRFQDSVGVAGPWARLFVQAASKAAVAGAVGYGIFRGARVGKWNTSDTNFVRGQR